METIPLEGWELASGAEPAPFVPIAGPMTVAAALRARGEWSFERPRDFDAETWWFRARLPAHDAGDVLRLEGLATLAEVFLDGRSVLRSDNMYHAHDVALPADARVLLLRFDPLRAALAQKRPRPRWKTRLASHQQLRWIRTSLVGRMPGWSPPVAPVGPWRPVHVVRSRPAPANTERDVARYLQTASMLAAEPPTERDMPDPLSTSPSLSSLSLSEAAQLPADVRVRVGVSGTTGIVTVSAPHGGVLVVGDARAVLVEDGDRWSARVEIAHVERWWPHTHGAQKRYPARIEGDALVDLGAVAFRTIALDSAEKRFALSVNGVPIFCRGACWTTLDVAALTSTPAEYRRVLSLVRDAGMNMLRLSGTLFYEADAFYEACDEIGILIWQDFMFANMDYPIADEALRASVEREGRELLRRLEHRPCLAMLCGGSEVEQQAAMFGAERGLWRSSLFEELLPALCREHRPDVPYWPSSPAGGALPFHVDEGAAHYYGVGAYLRPFEDARRAEVKFASECLAFANVPEDDLFPAILADGEAPFVHAKWKERTSKDHGSTWDFEDVRDHYVGRLFGVDPTRVRSEDVERYLALSRVASGEAMHRVLAEFRRAGSVTRGALVWFLQDLWPGAGWGILDSRGEPKSAFWYCRRAMQPLALFMTDEGANGLRLHVVNDGAAPLDAKLAIALYRDGETRTNSGSARLEVPARGTLALAADALLDRFADTAYAYRFGPPAHDVAVATLEVAGNLIDSAWLVDFAKPPAGGGLEGTLARTHVTVTTRRFAHAVRIVVPGYCPEDNYFDLAPGRTRTIPLRASASAKPRATLSGELSALNLREAIALKVDSP